MFSAMSSLSSTPGCYWLWEKEVDGRVLLLVCFHPLLRRNAHTSASNCSRANLTSCTFFITTSFFFVGMSCPPCAVFISHMHMPCNTRFLITPF